MEPVTFTSPEMEAPTLGSDAALEYTPVAPVYPAATPYDSAVIVSSEPASTSTSLTVPVWPIWAPEPMPADVPPVALAIATPTPAATPPKSPPSAWAVIERDEGAVTSTCGACGMSPPL